MNILNVTCPNDTISVTDKYIALGSTFQSRGLGKLGRQGPSVG